MWIQTTYSLKYLFRLTSKSKSLSTSAVKIFLPTNSLNEPFSNLNMFSTYTEVNYIKVKQM